MKKGYTRDVVERYSRKIINNYTEELKGKLEDSKAKNIKIYRYTYTTKQEFEAQAEKEIMKGGYGDWGAIYLISDTHDIVRYVGMTNSDEKGAWQRIADSNKEEYQKPKRNWKITIIFANAWYVTPRYIEKCLIEKYQEQLNNKQK